MAKKETKIIATGKIIEALPGGRFQVQLDEDFGSFIIKEAYLKGKLRQHNITIMVGDVVEVQISEYDLLKGIITKRIDNKV